MLDRLELLHADGLTAARNVLVSLKGFDVTALDVQSQLVEVAVHAHGEIRFIALDTTIYYTPSDIESENDNLGLARFIGYARELTKLPGRPCVMLLCHPPKSATNDPESLVPRGGSAVLAACDGNLALWRNEDGTLTLHHSAKMRGAFDELHFSIETKVAIPGVLDEDGTQVHSVRVTPMTAGEAGRRVTQGDATGAQIVLRAGCASATRPNGSARRPLEAGAGLFA